MKKLALLSLLFFFVAIGIDAKLPFMVRVVYFQPTDAQPAPQNLPKQVKDVQDLYRSEMIRHGYGAKTFRLETDNTGKVIVHTVKGRHNAQHYANAAGLSSTLNKELPAALKNPNNVHVFVIGNARSIKNGAAGIGFQIVGGVCGGFAAVAQKAANNIFSILAHEIGHAFGLYHGIDCGACLMGAGKKELTDYDARWLNNHHYFNEVHEINDVPQIARVFKLARHPTNNNIVKLKFAASSNIGLHQAQVLRLSDTAVVGWSELKGNRETAEIDIKRAYLFGDNRMAIQIMDVNGNQGLHVFSFSLPPAIVFVPINKEKLKETLKEEEPAEQPVKEDNAESEKPIRTEDKLSIVPHRKTITVWADLKVR